jgi:hypothetical protein
MRRFAPILPLLAAFRCAAALSLSPAGVCERPEEPAGLSGLAWAGENRYYAVADREGAVYPLTIDIDRSTGAPRSCSVGAPVRLSGARDVEGCAWDRFAGTLWVSDEEHASVREHDLRTGRALRDAPVPAVLKKPRWNLSLEALTLSDDGLTLWTANEETLPCDGARASVTNAGTVRLTRFVRSSPGAHWRAAGQWAYRTEKMTDRTNPTKLNRCGVSALAALPGGGLLVLEREMSGFIFHYRLFAVDRAGATDVSSIPALAAGDFTPVRKTPLAAGKERFSLFVPNERLANYEGMCLGPKLADGRRVLLLISDSGDQFSRPLIRAFVIAGLPIVPRKRMTGI